MRLMQEDCSNSQVPIYVPSITTSDEIQDNVKPTDTVSNIGNRTSRNQSSIAENGSLVSSTSSVHLKAEAEFVALKARQKMLKYKHELEDPKEQLGKRKEQLNLQEDL